MNRLSKFDKIKERFYYEREERFVTLFCKVELLLLYFKKYKIGDRKKYV